MTIYFDNAATTWPKPGAMIKAVEFFNSNIGSNPGRSGHHLSVESGRVLYETRDNTAELFGVDDPLRIVLTSNITLSLNIVLRGFLKGGDHVITSSMEHNSVMRPLRDLEKSGVELTVLQCDLCGRLNPGDIQEAIRSNTKLLILTHASNVTGTILPVEDAGKIAADHGIVFCVDSAQSAGILDIDVKKMNIDILCFTGHKGLYGPMGTGGFYLKKGMEDQIVPLMSGGTGSMSEFEQQPDFMPDKYESGTLNAIGFAGLAAGINFVRETGVDVIRKKEGFLTEYFIDMIKSVNGIQIYGPENMNERTSVVAFNIDEVSSSEVAYLLDEQYGIMSRPGLHCAPAAHKTIGTFPQGTNRFSFGFFNTTEEIDLAVTAIRNIIKKERH